MPKHTIAVLNQKGGVGKTTTSINVAAYLAKMGKDVVLVDFDPQGNATSGLGVDKTGLDLTVYDMLLGGASANEVAFATHLDGLRLIPASPQLAAAEVELVGVQNREQVGKRALTGLEADYAIIDCPPSLGLLSVNAMTAATHLLVPVQAEFYAMEGLGQLMGTIQLVKQALNTKIILLGIVVTMFDKRTTLSEQVYDELAKHFGQKVFKTIIPRNVRLAESPSFGKTIIEHDKWSKGARAYKQLAKEVVQRVEN